MHGVNLNTIDLNLLLAFEALFEERNVSRAAQRIGLSQPAMSHALNRLRSTFDDRLFVAIKRSMMPTTKAIAISHGITLGLSALRATIGTQTDFAPAACTQRFRVGMTDLSQALFLPSLLTVLTREAPNVQVRAYSLPNTFLVPEEELRSGKLDLAIGLFADSHLVGGGIHFQPLGSDSHVCLGRRGHPFLRGTLSMDRFVKARHVAVFSELDVQGMVDRALAASGRTRHLPITVPSFLAVPYIVAESDFLAVFPALLASRFAATLPLAIRPLPFALPDSPVGMTWHERSHNDPAHNWFREHFMTSSRTQMKEAPLSSKRN